MKTLKEKAAEVEQVNRDKGWYDEERTIGEMIALLHSEVSEALEAYRRWGLADATPPERPWEVWENPSKPEGVGSEFADVLIRLVDDASRWGVDLDRTVELIGPYGRFEIPDSFGDQIADLHAHIAIIYMANDRYSPIDTLPRAVATVYRYLCQLCDFHGIDLEAEYERKLTYNKTRPYRHGGKKL